MCKMINKKLSMIFSEYEQRDHFFRSMLRSDPFNEHWKKRLNLNDKVWLLRCNRLGREKIKT